MATNFNNVRNKNNNRTQNSNNKSNKKSRNYLAVILIIVFVLLFIGLIFNIVRYIKADPKPAVSIQKTETISGNSKPPKPRPTIFRLILTTQFQTKQSAKRQKKLLNLGKKQKKPLQMPNHHKQYL